MAYLTKSELKSLKKLPVLPRLVYVFSIKPRKISTENDVIARFEAGEDGAISIIEDEIDMLLLPGTDDTINSAAVKSRIYGMYEAGFISKPDVRKLHDLFGI